MKNIYLFGLMATIPMIAFAQDLTCAYSGVENPYQVSFDNENGAATVKKDDQFVRFGDLHCLYTKCLFGLYATCYSQGVWDGGFHASLFREQNDVFTAKLYEISIAGEKLIATFPCWEN